MPEKEQTASQTQADVFSMLGGITGFTQPSPGHYKLYRLMSNNPTIALAKAVATAPIRTANWHAVAVDGYNNEEAVNFVQSTLNEIWRGFIKNLLLGLDYGWSPFEKVWGVDDKGKLTYLKLKPLLVDITQILIDKDTGAFKGFKNKKVTLTEEYCFLWTNDKEAGNLYGRSRHENLREAAWTKWQETMDRFGKYISKVAGIIPMIEYPEGKSLDGNGVEQDNFVMAKKVLENLGRGNGVCMPNVLVRWAEDAVKSGIDITQMKAWVINFLEAKGNHSKGFTDALRYFDSLMMRGWLIPERAVLEGQHGTKAESQTQGDIGMEVADLLFEEILEYINWYLVNPLLVANWGEEAANKIKIKRSGPNYVTRALLTKIMEEVLTAPQNTDLFMQWLNVEEAIDTLSLPKNPNFKEGGDREENDVLERDIEKLNAKLEASLATTK